MRRQRGISASLKLEGKRERPEIFILGAPFPYALKTFLLRMNTALREKQHLLPLKNNQENS